MSENPSLAAAYWLYGRIKSAVKRVFFRSGMVPRKVLGGALRGRRLYLDLSQDTQVWRGIYERDLQHWLLENVTSGMTCLDIGAAEGCWTLLMALRAGTEGRVIAFEPSERGDWIERNLKLNHDLKIARVNIMRAYAAAEGCKEVGNTQVKSVDQCMVELGILKIHVVKIDVDGAELDVLRGMNNALIRDRPRLAVEIHSQELCEKVKDLMESLSYSCRLAHPPAYEHRPIGFNPTLYCVPRA